MGGRRQALLLMDANVLIDYLDVDRGLFRLSATHVGQVHVPAPLLQDEILDVDIDWPELGIVVVEPSLEMLVEAGRRRDGLSFHDWICLLMAEHYGWTCVTNDKRLRRECAVVGVPTVWGLELLVQLVDARALSARAAQEIADAIRAANPGYVTDGVMSRFRQKIQAVRDSRRRG